MFDKGLVEVALRGTGRQEVEWYCREVLKIDSCTGGWPDIQVTWLPEGTRFEITEYDGSEQINTRQLPWEA